MNIKYLIPIINTEIYLIFTLLLFSFGPVEYHLDNPFLFWLCIALYHIGMVQGYVLGAIPFKRRIVSKKYFKDPSIFKIRVLMFIAFIGFLVMYQNATMSDSLIPSNLFSNIKTGFLESHIQYTLMDKQFYTGNKLLSIFFFFVAFARIVLVPVTVFYWEKLGIVDKVLALAINFLPFLTALSVGKNKLIFDFVILFAASLFLYFVASFYREGKYNFKKRKFFIILTLMFFGLSIWFFGTAMIGRGGDPSYIESTSPLGHIKIEYAYLSSDQDSILSYTYVWLSSYLVQGYYGFSQSLNVDFTSTFGLGNSPFLTRQYEWLTGNDISQYTYQHKIDSVWNETAQWHTLYSQIANDIHFLGVVVWNFIIGFYLARLWRSFLDENNLYAMCLLPLFVMLIIYTPANNQVFGYLDTFSAFFFLTLLWLGHRYKQKNIPRN